MGLSRPKYMKLYEEQEEITSPINTNLTTAQPRPLEVRIRKATTYNYMKSWADTPELVAGLTPRIDDSPRQKDR